MAKKKLNSLEAFLKANDAEASDTAFGKVIYIEQIATEEKDLCLLEECSNLWKVSFSESNVSDEGLRAIERLSQLKQLSLSSCPNVSDKGMESVSKLTQLDNLVISDCAIGNDGLGILTGLNQIEDLELRKTKTTDSGLEVLKCFSALRKLDIGGNCITDSGLQYVGRLTQLKSLNLSYHDYTDTGLAYLKDLKNLTYLTIQDTRITGAGFKSLKGLVKLEQLYATRTAFTDDNLKFLAPFKNLKSFYLVDTPITDKGLKHLKGLTKLKDLNLRLTGVTKEGKAKLKAVLPRCVIDIFTKQHEEEVEEIDDEYFWSHAPRCIAKFSRTPAREEEVATFRLACPCGSKTGSVVGYPLSKYDRDYKGAEFVGPLGFRCLDCRKTTEIIDTDDHGYNGEFGGSSTIRGKGKRVAYRCSKCDGESLTVIVHFRYDDGALDLKEDDPDIAIEDFFDCFTAYGVCAECGSRDEIANFECA